MSSKITVLVIGGTGHLGSLIVKHLLEHDNVIVRVLVRSKTIQEKKSLIDEFKSKGVAIYEGEIDGDHLKKALEGVHTVVSALIGGPDAIVDAQRRILHSAESVGVQRMVPSDFSFDTSRLNEGDNFFSDLRKQFGKDLDNSKVKKLSIINGWFLETVFHDFSRLFDLKLGTMSYYGDGTAKINFTSYDDTARFTAAAIAKPDLVGTLRFSADSLTFHELAEAYERATGRKIVSKSLGPVEVLKKQIAESWNQHHNPFALLPDGRFVISGQYHWPLAEGKTSYQNLDNDKFPQIKPETAEEWMRRNSSNLV